MNLMSVHNILKQINFYPYNIQFVQELNDNYFAHHAEFCELKLQRIGPNFLFNINCLR